MTGTRRPSRLLRIQLLSAVLAAAFLRPAIADTVTQVLSQAGGKHWMLKDNGGTPTPSNYWSNVMAPTNGHDYVVPAGMTLRTPVGGGAPDFIGDSLRIDAGATLALKMGLGQDSRMLGDLIVNGGSVGAWVGTTGGEQQRLNLNSNELRITANSAFSMVGDNRRRVRILDAALTGAGDLTITGNEIDDLLVMDPTVTGDAYAGDWILSGGRLSVFGGSVFGTADGGTIIQTNAAMPSWDSPTLDLNSVLVGAEPLEMNSGAANLRTRLRALSGTNTWGGPITLKGDGPIQINADGASTVLTLSGTVTGTNATRMMIRGNGGTGVITGTFNVPDGEFFKTDSGTWVIATNGHAWIRTGLAKGSVELGADDALPPTAPLTLGQGGSGVRLDLSGYDQAVARLVHAAGSSLPAVLIGNSASNTLSVLTVNGATNGVYGGIIQDGLGSGTGQVALVVADGQELTLSGNNTYTGPTTISNAVLFVSGSVVSDIDVQGGSTYGGGGRCGNLVVHAGATQAPGLNGIGTDTVAGDYDLRGTLALELTGVGIGGSDRLVVSNMLTVGAAATLALTNLDQADKFVYVLAEYGARTGAFAVTNGVPADYAVMYDYGADSNQLVLARTVHKWDGTGVGDLWATDGNWADDASPLTTTTNGVWFDNEGTTTNGPRLQTSLLDQDRTVGDLLLETDGGEFHSIEMTGATLRVSGDLLVSGPGRNTHVTFTDSVGGSSLVMTNGSLYMGYNGAYDTLAVDSAFVFSNTNGVIDLARREGAITSNTVTTFNMSNAPMVDVTCEDILVATATPQNGGAVAGKLTFSHAGTNRVVASSLTAGVSPTAGNTGIASEFHFGGGRTELNIDTFTAPFQKSVVNMDVKPGAALVLRGRSKPGMNLRLGLNQASGTGTKGAGTLNARGATVDALLDTLELGSHISGSGHGRGTFIMDAGSATASNVVLAITGGTNPQDTHGNLTIEGGTFTVTDSVTNGNGQGVIRVDHGVMTVSNMLNVCTLLAGGNGNRTGHLAVVDGPVQLGVGNGNRNLYAARNLASVNSRCEGTIDFSTAPSVTATLANLGVGQGNHQNYGTLLLSESGTNDIMATTVTVGDCNPEGNTAAWSHLVCGGTTHIGANAVYVGRRKSQGELNMVPGSTVTIGSVSNPVPFLRVGFNDVNTGTHTKGLVNGSNGTLRVYADDVIVGRHSTANGTWNGSGTGWIALDSSNDLFVANNMMLGDAWASSAVARASGSLIVSDGAVYAQTVTLAGVTNTAWATGRIALSGGSLTAGTIQPGSNRAGTATFDFDWTGGELTVGTFDETLVQDGGTLVPGGTNVGSTVVTRGYRANAGTWAVDVDGTGDGTNDHVRVTGLLDLNGAGLVVTELVAADDPEYILAEYGSRSGTFATADIPKNYRLKYGHGTQGNQVALLFGRPGTALIVR
jgi:autotransporter-associated beta strand protein